MAAAEFSRALTSRWFMVFACLLILSMSGATYIFAVYSNDIKTSLGYTQTTLNLISFFKDLGANIGVIYSHNLRSWRYFNRNRQFGANWESARVPNEEHSHIVSIWNYLGRVVSGFASEIFLAKYKFPRPLMLTLVLLISCSGHLLIAFGVPNSLYLSGHNGR